MKVVLLADVEGTGRRGETAKVDRGYAYNYLIPKRLAVPRRELESRVHSTGKNGAEGYSIERGGRTIRLTESELMGAWRTYERVRFEAEVGYRLEHTELNPQYATARCAIASGSVAYEDFVEEAWESYWNGYDSSKTVAEAMGRASAHS